MGPKEIQELGFAIAAAAFLLTLFGWYIRHNAKATQRTNQELTNAALKALEESREDLRAKDVLIENHMDHLTEAVAKMNELTTSRETAMIGGFDRVVEAIHGQSALMKEMLDRDCPLRPTRTRLRIVRGKDPEQIEVVRENGSEKALEPKAEKD